MARQLDLYVGVVFRAVLPLLLLTATTACITSALLLRRRRFREAANGGAITITLPLTQQAVHRPLSAALGDLESPSQMVPSGKVANAELRGGLGPIDAINTHNINIISNINYDQTRKLSAPEEALRIRSNTWAIPVKYTKSAPVDSMVPPNTPADFQANPAANTHKCPSPDDHKPELKVTAASPPVSPVNATLIPPIYQKNISVVERQVELENITSSAPHNRPHTLISSTSCARVRYTPVAARSLRRDSIQRCLTGENKMLQAHKNGVDIRTNWLLGAASLPHNGAQDSATRKPNGPCGSRLVSPTSPSSPMGCTNGNRPRDPTSPGAPLTDLVRS